MIYLHSSDEQQRKIAGALREQAQAELRRARPGSTPGEGWITILDVDQPGL
jgi:hypothetical protein